MVLAKIMVPETGEPVTKGSMPVNVEKKDANVIEAAASGASEGVALALNVGGMLIAFIALIATVNALVSWAGGLFGHPGFTMQSILGTLLRPLAWVMGVPWQDTQYVAGLIGVKTILNEFVAFGSVRERPQEPGGRTSRRAARSSPPTRWWASRTSRASPSRSAASAAWPPTARARSRAWACAA